jgi:glycine betaine/proline transport system ATP-binding protein
MLVSWMNRSARWTVDPQKKCRMNSLRLLPQQTIVFITHDFGEALRLADHIAIMKTARLSNVTPDQIISHPATEYVHRWRALIKPASCMQVFWPPLTQGGRPVDTKATIKDLAKLLVHDTRDVIPCSQERQVSAA